MEREEQTGFLSLPEAALVSVVAALCGDARDLAAVGLTCRALRGLDVDRAAWRPACACLWKGKPRWEPRAAEEEKGAGACPGRSWKDSYRLSLWQAAQPLHSHEMHQLRWFMCFKDQLSGAAGELMDGLLPLRVMEVKFTIRGMRVPGYPLLPYKLEPDGDHDMEVNGSGDFEESREQTLLIASFPPHCVTRLPSWEWLIENDNVVVWSCAESEDIRSPAFRHPKLRWPSGGGPALGVKLTMD